MENLSDATTLCSKKHDTRHNGTHTVILSVANKPIMLCHYTECRYAECHGAVCNAYAIVTPNNLHSGSARLALSSRTPL